MFDISLMELLLVVIVGTIFIGPKEFPVVVKTCARLFYNIKRLWHEIKVSMEELAKQSGIDDIRRELEEEYRGDVKMIQGDDGQWYEAYDMEELADLPMLGYEKNAPPPKARPLEPAAPPANPENHHDS